MAHKPLILLEFNELCPTFLDRYMADGSLPNFRRLYERSTVCVTDAEESPPNLEPWIQWPTVHFGVPFSEHHIFHLGDGRRYEREGIAKILSDAGVRVGVCGSMNVNYGRLNGYMIPDPWDREGEAFPDFLRPFCHTVASQVQNSSQPDAGSKTDLLKFGWFLIRHGLTLGTVRTVLKHLWQEHRDPGVRWRRASLLDLIQYDVALSLNRKMGIQFATFFCNSTAHYQHYFWRNMEPERFAEPPPSTDHPSLRDAVPYGYRAMDRLIGRFLDDYSDWVIVLCTALSQQPWVDTNKCTYRPTRFEDVLEFVGVATGQVSVKPVMAEEFVIDCPSEQLAVETERRLLSLIINGKALMRVERTNASLFVGCAIFTLTSLEADVVRQSDHATRRFGDLFHIVHGLRSGRHHADGVFWIGNGTQRVVQEKLPLTGVAPIILRHFSQVAPHCMTRWSADASSTGRTRRGWLKAQSAAATQTLEL
jgi:hypothetical protein